MLSSRAASRGCCILAHLWTERPRRLRRRDRMSVCDQDCHRRVPAPRSVADPCGFCAGIDYERRRRAVRAATISSSPGRADGELEDARGDRRLLDARIAKARLGQRSGRERDAVYRRLARAAGPGRGRGGGRERRHDRGTAASCMSSQRSSASSRRGLSAGRSRCARSPRRFPSSSSRSTRSRSVYRELESAGRRDHRGAAVPRRRPPRNSGWCSKARPTRCSSSCRRSGATRC